MKSIERRVSTIDLRKAGSPSTKRLRGRHNARIRDRILLRDEYTCRICGRVSADLEVDHITPLHLGGAESDQNRQAICKPCHKAKTEKEEKGRGG